MSPFEYVMSQFEQIELDLLAKEKMNKSDRYLFLNNLNLKLGFKVLGKANFDSHFKSCFIEAQKSDTPYEHFCYIFHKAFRQIDICEFFNKSMKIYRLDQEYKSSKLLTRDINCNSFFDSFIWSSLNSNNSFCEIVLNMFGEKNELL